ncbi:MAG: hypothetical protein IIU58_06840, partial [Clostridia bacterium]|nr:hypothetical protein [Clostridia bacterium]
MYIVKRENGYAVQTEPSDAIAHISAPIVEENGKEFVLSPTEEGYAGHGFFCTETVEPMENGLFKVTRVLKNDGFTPRIIKLIFEAVTVFTPTRYLIPCVSYNGNYWGEGKEPKGMLCEETGEPWIHSYDRTPVPSCSITETKEIAFSLFASNETTESLVSSVSLRPAGEGRISQRIYWPVTEAPFTYYENDKYNAPLHTYITLGAGETFTVSVYMLCSVPKWENYGACATLDRALELFPFTRGANRTPDELWRLGIAYSRFLLREHKGKLLFSSGIHPTTKGPYFVPHYEVGWCGQNIMNARMLVLEYLRTGEKELLEKAMT